MKEMRASLILGLFILAATVLACFLVKKDVFKNVVQLDSGAVNLGSVIHEKVVVEITAENEDGERWTLLEQTPLNEANKSFDHVIKQIATKNKDLMYSQLQFVKPTTLYYSTHIIYQTTTQPSFDLKIDEKTVNFQPETAMYRLVKKQLVSFVNGSLANINQSLYLTKKLSPLPDPTFMKDVLKKAEPVTESIQPDYDSYSDAAADAANAAADAADAANAAAAAASSAETTAASEASAMASDLNDSLEETDDVTAELD